MSIKRINEFPAASGANLTADDVFLFMDDPSGSAETKKVSLATLSSVLGTGGGIGGNADTGDISFNGVQIIGSGTGSGDGNGYGTIELVPDSNLYNNDQYLIVDPTQPNHIHLRAGGNQDNSNAELFIGGEKANLSVRDNSQRVRMQTETIVNNNSYYLNTGSEFSSAVWETVDNVNRVVINNPTQSVYDAVWAFSEPSVFTVYNNDLNSSLTVSGSSTPGDPNPIIIYVDEAPPANPTSLNQLSFEINQLSISYIHVNGSDIRMEAADDVRIYSNDVFRLYNYASNEPIEIITDYDDQEHTWSFGSDGSLQFPDGSKQQHAAHIPTVVQLGNASGVIDTDASLGSIFDITLMSSGILANPSNSTDGQSIRWRITHNANNIPFSLGTDFRIPSSASSPLPFSTASGVTDLLAATYDQSRNKWDIIAFVPGY